MSARNDGGPAYPVVIQGDRVFSSYPGMSLRDAFAIAALPWLCVPRGAAPDGIIERAARAAYALADAMLAEREK